MFYLSLAALTWVAAIWVVRWHRIRELLVYGLWGCLIAALEDQVTEVLGLWHYIDFGPIRSHDAIIAIIMLSAAPLFAICFVQGLKVDAPIPWRRVLLYTGVSLLPEILGLHTGHLFYKHGWRLSYSVLAYLPTWISLWALHRWITTHAPERTRIPPLH